MQIYFAFDLILPRLPPGSRCSALENYTFSEQCEWNANKNVLTSYQNSVDSQILDLKHHRCLDLERTSISVVPPAGNPAYFWQRSRNCDSFVSCSLLIFVDFGDLILPMINISMVTLSYENQFETVPIQIGYVMHFRSEPDTFNRLASPLQKALSF